MRDQIVLRMSPEGNTDVVQWIKLGSSAPSPSVKQGALKDFAEEIGSAKVIVLAPSEHALLTSVSIPTTNKQRLLKAIPFALEEELASDVEQLHFALGSTDESGRTSVAIIAKSTMDLWQQQFSDAGLNVDAIIPEVLTLPLAAESWSLLIEAQGALLRTGELAGYRIDLDNLEFVLPLALGRAEEKPKQLHISSFEDEKDYSPLISDDIELIQHNNVRNLLWLLANEEQDFSKNINLLQGSYSQREQLGKLWRPWRFAASLAGIWFILQTTLAMTESAQLEAKSVALKEEIRQIYKETFPEAKRIVKPRAQMKQKLAELKGDGKVSRETFLSLLSNSGKTFKNTPGLVLRSVRFKNGTLDVEIDVPSLQILDRLKQKLTDNGRMSVEIQSAASRNNKVQGRLQIKGLSS